MTGVGFMKLDLLRGSAIQLVRGATFALAAMALALPAVSPVFAADDHPSSEPVIPEGATRVDHTNDVFGPDPSYEEKPYSPDAQFEIYGNKKPAPTPRPLLELGRKIYTGGPFEEGIDIVGEKNLVYPRLSIFGDWKTALEYNDNGNDERGHIATTLNLDIDLGITATERIHAFVQPLEQADVTRYEFFGDDEDGFDEAINGNLETLFFEGDVGAIMTGLTNEEQDFDLPIAFGLTPFFFQNGIWVDEVIIGGATSIVAKNSPMLTISNMDFTFFFGLDNVENPNILDAEGVREEHDLDVYGMAGFVEATEGYYEFGIGRIEGHDDFDDQSFNSLTLAYSSRYGSRLSNSVRGVWSFGQDRANNQEQTVDGFALLVENSFITHKPSTLIPYANFFVGIDKPAPLIDATGLLKNTGITFESGGLQGFPKLDDSANDTFGGAIGIQYLFNLDQQIVAEVATNQVIGGFDLGRKARDDEYAVGLRYQLPIAPTWILRADAIYGIRTNNEDVRGARLEMRYKF